MREGAALLQGIAVCGRCGRRLATHYRGRRSTPGYHCAGRTLVNGRGVWCLSVGGVQLDQAVAGAFLAALTPAGLQAAVAAAERLEADHDAALAQWRLEVERARYQATKAERRYLAVDPTTAWSPVAWSATGRPSLPRWPRPRPSWPAGSGGVPGP